MYGRWSQVPSPFQTDSVMWSHNCQLPEAAARPEKHRRRSIAVRSQKYGSPVSSASRLKHMLSAGCCSHSRIFSAYLPTFAGGGIGSMCHFAGSSVPSEARTDLRAELSE